MAKKKDIPQKVVLREMMGNYPYQLWTYGD